jgi:hypothetical protein
MRCSHAGVHAATWFISVIALVPIREGCAQATRHSVSGIVQDTTGRPLESAVVVLDPLEGSRAVRVDDQGRFRFNNVSPGRHQLRTSWIGYRPDDRTLEVPEEGLNVRVTLQVLPFLLDTLPIFAHRTGIFGTVLARDDFRTLGSADVDVFGTSIRARTKADGAFRFPAVREGAWIVETRRDGFRTSYI